MRSFTNLYLGKPFKETGARPKVKKIIENRGTYKSGETPNEVLWITAGADVQRGRKFYERYSDNDIEKEYFRLLDDKKDPWKAGLPRIEMLVLGHGHGYRTHAIEYKIFYGSTLNTFGGAWAKMRAWMEDTKLTYTRLDGSKIPCQMVFIDSGDGERTSTVYSFCEPYPGIIPIKGDQWDAQRKKEKGDELKQSFFKKYVISKINQTEKLVTIATNHYKQLIYTRLKIRRVMSDEQNPGFMEFPLDFPDYFFKMLTSEERLQDGSFHAGERKNESLDCCVYAVCAGDVLLDSWVENAREKLVESGMSRGQAKKVYTHRTHIERLKLKRWAEMGRKVDGEI